MQATRLISSLLVTAKRISVSRMPASSRVTGLCPCPIRTWTSRVSETLRMASGSLSMTTTSLFSCARRLATLNPTSPAPMIMIFTV